MLCKLHQKSKKKLNKGNNVLNWTSNSLCVEGDDTKVQEFINKVKSNNEELDEDCEYAILNNLFPTPADIGDAWYEWNIDNWGTKWADKETYLSTRNNGHACFRFDSAWSPPLNGIGHISMQFPDLTFILTFTEESMGFAGCAGYTNGLMVHAQSEEISIDEEHYKDDNDLWDAISDWWQEKAQLCEYHVRSAMKAHALETLNN